MTNITVARPYAKAAFETALEQNALPSWSAWLKQAALAVSDQQIRSMLNHPRVSQEQIATLINDINTASANMDAQNFINILAQSKRLAALPEINNLFEHYCAEQQKLIEVQVISAFALDATSQEKLAAALAKRLQRKVKLHCTVDSQLLGGVIIKAGDLVIDDSVRGKLQRLEVSLKG